MFSLIQRIFSSCKKKKTKRKNLHWCSLIAKKKTILYSLSHTHTYWRKCRIYSYITHTHTHYRMKKKFFLSISFSIPHCHWMLNIENIYIYIWMDRFHTYIPYHYIYLFILYPNSIIINNISNDDDDDDDKRAQWTKVHRCKIFFFVIFSFLQKNKIKKYWVCVCVYRPKL